VSRIEEGKLVALTIAQAIVVADAVGLDVSVKAYPGRRPTRYAGHTRKMTAFLAHVARPVRFATEVALPPREAARERRAWDAMLFAPDGDTGVELEMRLYDMQAQTRRLFLKWRDSGVERLLLLVDDSRTNRHALALFPEYLNGLPRIRTAMLYAALERGERPPSAYALI
jgi:hypothetical protein